MSAAALPAAYGTPPSGPALSNRRAWLQLGLLALTLAVGAVWLLSLTARPLSTRPLSPTNPGPDGTMALAEVLRQRGVTVDVVYTAADVAAQAGPDSTVVVSSFTDLPASAWRQLRQAGGDIVLLGPDRLSAPLVPQSVEKSYTYLAADELSVGCEDPDAQAAGRLAHVAGAFPPPPGATACFVARGQALYLVLPAPDDSPATVRVLADGYLAANSQITQEGNAALLLRLLGKTSHLVWYLPTTASPSQAGTPTLPPLLLPLLAYLLFLALAIAWWRGKHFGPVVVEELPAVIPAAETIHGRAALYRRARDRRHVARVLRAATALRLGKALGLPAHTDPHTFLDRLVPATGRNRHELTKLFYGEAPTTDAALVQLAQDLAALEQQQRK